MNARLLICLVCFGLAVSCTSGSGATDSGASDSGGSGGGGGSSDGGGGSDGGTGGGTAVCDSAPLPSDLAFFDACRSGDGGGPYPLTFRVRNAGVQDLALNTGPSGFGCATSSILARCDGVAFNPQVRCPGTCGCAAEGCQFRYAVIDAGASADIPFDGFMTAYGCNCRQMAVPQGRYRVTMNFNRRDGTFSLPDGGRLAATKDFELPVDGGIVFIDLAVP